MTGSRLPSLFWLLALTNLFVGGMVGLERTLVPLLATRVFHLALSGAALAFIASFGISKALGNLAVGALADRYGRLAVLRAGWLLAWPVPVVLLLAQNWTAVILVNVLLGVQQALTWSMTVNMMIDAAGPGKRGLATGLNELAGYLGVSVVAFVTGLLVVPLPHGAWGWLPLVLLARSFELPQVAAVASTYTLVWALSQAVFGPLSDQVGR